MKGGRVVKWEWMRQSRRLPSSGTPKLLKTLLKAKKKEEKEEKEEKEAKKGGEKNDNRENS